MALRPPEKDIGPARAPAWAGLAVLGLFGVLILGFGLIERLGLDAGRVPQGITAAALAAFSIAALLSHARRLEDYYLADSDVSPATAGMALAATFAGLISVGLVTGGFHSAADAVIAALAPVAGFAVAAAVFVPRRRRLLDGIAEAFGDDRKGRIGRSILAAAGFLPAFTLFVTLLATTGALLSIFMGLSPRGGMSVATLVVVLAVLPGGLRSLRATQVVQFATMAAGLLLAEILLATDMLAAGVPAPRPDAATGALFPLEAALASSGGVGRIVAFVVAALGVAALPQVLVVAPSAASRRRAAAGLIGAVALSATLFAAALALSIGVAGASDPFAGLVADDLFLASGPLLSALSPLTAGLLVASVFAALLAAAGGALASAAAVLSRDVADGIVDRGGPSGRQIFTARLAVAAVGSWGAWIATGLQADASALLAWALALAAAGRFGPLAVAFWWKGCRPIGLTLGTATGLAVVAAAGLIDAVTGLAALEDAGLRRIGPGTAGALGLALATGATVAASWLGAERERMQQAASRPATLAAEPIPSARRVRSRRRRARPPRRAPGPLDAV